MNLGSIAAESVLVKYDAPLDTGSAQNVDSLTVALGGRVGGSELTRAKLNLTAAHPVDLYQPRSARGCQRVESSMRVRQPVYASVGSVIVVRPRSGGEKNECRLAILFLNDAIKISDSCAGTLIFGFRDMGDEQPVLRVERRTARSAQSAAAVARRPHIRTKRCQASQNRLQLLLDRPQHRHNRPRCLHDRRPRSTNPQEWMRLQSRRSPDRYQ
jgi:hypothetical protein